MVKIDVGSCIQSFQETRVWENWSWGGHMLEVEPCASTSNVPETATQTKQCGGDRQRQREESEGMLFVEDG